MDTRFRSWQHSAAWCIYFAVLFVYHAFRADLHGPPLKIIGPPPPKKSWLRRWAYSMLYWRTWYLIMYVSFLQVLIITTAVMPFYFIKITIWSHSGFAAYLPHNKRLEKTVHHNSLHITDRLCIINKCRLARHDHDLAFTGENFDYSV